MPRSSKFDDIKVVQPHLSNQPGHVYHSPSPGNQKITYTSGTTYVVSFAIIVLIVLLTYGWTTRKSY